MDSKAKSMVRVRNHWLQGRTQEDGQGRGTEEEGRMNERSLEVSLATKGFEMILKQEHSLI